MSAQNDIKASIERISRVYRAKPASALGSVTSTTRLENGLRCTSSEGQWTLQTDMPAIVGGTDSAPSPGVLGRAALGSCLCVCYSMWAARSGITMESIEVDIIADYNDAAFLGAVDAPPGYTGVQYRVTVCSDAAESDILRVLDLADKHSPYLDVFSRDQQCVRQVVIKNPTEKDRS